MTQMFDDMKILIKMDICNHEPLWRVFRLKKMMNPGIKRHYNALG